jgi:hypothetical protein
MFERCFWIAYFLEVVRRLMLKDNRSKEVAFGGGHASFKSPA